MMDQKPNMMQRNECPWQVPGMAYVPWQTFGETYDPRQALKAGTIFPELDKPFTGNCMMRSGGKNR